MRVKSVPIRDLNENDVQRWNAWAAPQGRLISPYLLHDFAAAVDHVRGDVRVAVIEAEGAPAGYFAYHSPKGGVIRPVGAPMSDYQGVVTPRGFDLPMTAILGAARACALVYDNWFGPAGRSGVRERDGSAIADLASGGAAYLAAQRARWRDHFRKLDRRLRAAEEAHGPARIVFRDADGGLFETLAAWKSAQYAATGKLDVLGVSWARQLIDDIRQGRCGQLSGLTAALYFGGRLAAVEFGLKAGGVYHSWFPAYEPDLAKYSPGLLLMHGIFENAERLGIARVDLGCGGAHYKKYYASDEIPLASGRVLAPGLAAFGIQSWEAAEAAARLLPDRIAQLPVRARRRWSQVSAFEPDMGSRIAAFTRAF